MERTNFRCYTCGKHFYTKQNLTLVEEHLHCEACIASMSKGENVLFDVVYQTKRGLEKNTTLRVNSIAEANEYIITRKNATVVSVTKRLVN